MAHYDRVAMFPLAGDELRAGKPVWHIPDTEFLFHTVDFESLKVSLKRPGETFDRRLFKRAYRFLRPPADFYLDRWEFDRDFWRWRRSFHCRIVHNDEVTLSSPSTKNALIQFYGTIEHFFEDPPQYFYQPRSMQPSVRSFLRFRESSQNPVLL